MARFLFVTLIAFVCTARGASASVDDRAKVVSQPAAVASDDHAGSEAGDRATDDDSDDFATATGPGRHARATGRPPVIDDDTALGMRWLDRYKPNYFLWGNPDSKIQFSARVRVLENDGLFFAYSQLMFWDIPLTSSPMSDVNFNPELFYRFGLGEGDLDLGFFEHESNGKSADESRAWNRSYLRYTFRGDDLEASFKVWAPYTSSFDAANPDLLEYRGLYEVTVTAKNLLGGSFRHNDLTLRLYPGGPSHIDPFGGGQELTLRFAVKTSPQFTPMWTAQVFNGYGEGLLYYYDRRTIFRAGLSF